MPAVFANLATSRSKIAQLRLKKACKDILISTIIKTESFAQRDIFSSGKKGKNFHNGSCAKLSIWDGRASGGRNCARLNS